MPVKRCLVITLNKEENFPEYTDFLSDAQVWSDNEGREFAYGYSVDDRHFLTFVGIVTYSFSDHDATVVAFPFPETKKAVIEDLYWRSALPMVLQMQGQGVLHAGAVLTPSGVVGFCAEAGTGKSTLIYSLSQRGYSLWTDDAVIFDALQGPVKTDSLPFKVRLRPDAGAYFDSFGLSKESSLYWQRDFEQAPLESAALRAIIVLKRHDGQADSISLTRLKGAQALQELMANGYAFSLKESSQRNSFSQQYLNLAALVPVFELSFPTGLHHLANTIDRLELFLQQDTTIL